LKALISKRHTLAQLLGFENFTHYDLSDQMAQSPEIVAKLYNGSYSAEKINNTVLKLNKIKK
jgi:Zn-dependent oligopeptidase